MSYLLLAISAIGFWLGLELFTNKICDKIKKDWSD